MSPGWCGRCGWPGIPVPGGTMSVSSDVPMGSGLSSSAALECAALGALASSAHRPDGPGAARPARGERVCRCANGFARSAVLAVRCSGDGAADRLPDLTVCRCDFDPSSSGVALLLIDSRERHGHVDGEYAARRAVVRTGGSRYGRGVATGDPRHRCSRAGHRPVDARRARHVLTENQRVLDFVAALGDSDYAEAGRIFTASHASMRDDFAITTPHIDLIADTAVEAGALGARMTGGGFGGCVIALVPATGWARWVRRCERRCARGLRRASDQPDVCRAGCGRAVGAAVTRTSLRP